MSLHCPLLIWETGFDHDFTRDEQTKTPWTATAALWRLQTRFHTGEEGIAPGCAARLTQFHQDVAESLGIAGLPDVVASALASDVEYRIHQVVEVGLSLVSSIGCSRRRRRRRRRQEAARFMRHGRRTTMTTSDVDHALHVLNIEPLYGHSAHNPPTFRRALPFPHLQAAGPVYFVEDEEIDFDRVIREEKIVLPKTVSWTSHWLAVEGVQPLIPENPPAIPREVDQPQQPDASKAQPQPNGSSSSSNVFPLTPPSPAAKKQQHQLQQQQQLVKHVLSRELQLYYSRLTSSLLPPLPSEQAKRTAALASLRNDAGLQALLPYLIRWVGEGVVGALKEGGQSENDGRVLEVLMDVIGTLLENNTLFVEPYVSCALDHVDRLLITGCV